MPQRVPRSEREREGRGSRAVGLRRRPPGAADLPRHDQLLIGAVARALPRQRACHHARRARREPGTGGGSRRARHHLTTLPPVRTVVVAGVRNGRAERSSLRWHHALGHRRRGLPRAFRVVVQCARVLDTPWVHLTRVGWAEVTRAQGLRKSSAPAGNRRAKPAGLASGSAAISGRCRHRTSRPNASTSTPSTRKVSCFRGRLIGGGAWARGPTGRSPARLGIKLRDNRES
jgi:hypothetical protein